MFTLPAFRRVYFISFPHIFRPQESHNVVFLIKKLGFWKAETFQDLLDVTVYGGEVIPFFHSPARLWHRNAAPDYHKGGSYISKERAVAAVGEHSSFEHWLQERFCMKHM
ncbi:hypothetical protein EK904_009472 [Melospiza melodia maxima]|nr:hypothetical protein EK904_009472 [Melospiza melodia maxima]